MIEYTALALFCLIVIPCALVKPLSKEKADKSEEK